jgi:hypothetical protein
VRFRWSFGLVRKFGQRMGKVGSGVGTDDAVSCCIYGAGRGGRTPTRLPSADFESAASASSAIPASGWNDAPKVSHRVWPLRYSHAQVNSDQAAGDGAGPPDHSRLAHLPRSASSKIHPAPFWDWGWMKVTAARHIPCDNEGNPDESRLLCNCSFAG